MDYRKIGQGLAPTHDVKRNAANGLAMPNLTDKSLDELGLVGLVERLALAIKRAS